MSRLVWIPLVLLLPSSVQPQSSITFCDLLRTPEKFNGQQVTIRATWRYGFEWSELYCLDCLDRGKAWLEPSFSSLDESSRRRLKRIPKGAGIVNLTIQGTFHAGDTYGHLNGYRYEIMADTIRNLVVLSKGMKNRNKEEEIEKRWACGGAHPR
ncbi:MAG TPA: hypothetical protein VFR84_10350 [Candidatus Angelobacter sp.]|nr:hypothetical protein [Candidatus Angelobacter sp.]